MPRHALHQGMSETDALASDLGRPFVLRFLDKDAGGVNVHAGSRFLFEHQHLEAACHQLPRAGQAGKSRPDHYNVVLRHLKNRTPGPVNRP